MRVSLCVDRPDQHNCHVFDVEQIESVRTMCRELIDTSVVLELGVQIAGDPQIYQWDTVNGWLIY